jgi:hypothetical protein
MWIREQENLANELIAGGKIEEAINLCEIIADYYYGEESNCDRAGEFAEGMRASRNAALWSGRARELKQRKGAQQKS